jgi:hypothetical protein
VLIPTRSRRRGFLGLDVVLAVGLTMLVFLFATAAYEQYASARQACEVRTRLRLAAEAELLRLRASGHHPAEDAAPSRPDAPAADDIILETSTRPGTGVWSGLTHLTVVARTRVPGGWAQVELTAYVPRPEVLP